MDYDTARYLAESIGESVAMNLPEQPTLRDQFAMSFLSGMARGYKICTGFTKGGNVDKVMALDAALAYGMADNMLKAREEK